jgi:hypothetical protein
MSHPDFDKAVQHVTAEAVRSALIDLVNIPSATGHEIEVARYLVKRMSRFGLDTELQLVDENRPIVPFHCPSTHVLLWFVKKPAAPRCAPWSGVFASLSGKRFGAAVPHSTAQRVDTRSECRC